jgi:hypothetical protein
VPKKHGILFHTVVVVELVDVTIVKVVVVENVDSIDGDMLKVVSMEFFESGPLDNTMLWLSLYWHCTLLRLCCLYCRFLEIPLK